MTSLVTYPLVVLCVILALTALIACSKRSPGAASYDSEPEAPESVLPTASPNTSSESDAAAYAKARERVVKTQLSARDIHDPAVLAAMRTVPRHALVPEELRERAYLDGPLPIGERQTISQPYIVALMTQLAKLDSGSRVLEIGTGSGYQAAVLAEICKDVYTIEILELLGLRAREILTRLGYKNIQYRIGDGYRGWPEAAPFDAILVTAAPPAVPEPLKAQLAVGGRLVIPVGQAYQRLRIITRTDSGFDDREVTSVLFVPMTGEAQK